MNTKKILHYINNPETNKLTAPENKLYRPEIHFGKAAIVTISTICLTLFVSWCITLVFIHQETYNAEQNSRQAIFISIYWKVQILVLLLTLKYIFIWLVYLGFLCRENMQIEGFWYYLFLGVFEAATIHYVVAKIFGPLLFGRGWCGYACWTAMVLDLLD